MPSRRALPFVVALVAACAVAGAAHSAPPAPRPGPTAGIPGAPTPHSGAGQVKGNLTLLYGDDHVFGVVPPPGWVVDDTSGLGSKIRVVMYPRGQKWATAPTVIYSNPLHQDPRARRTFAQMLERDAADFHKQSPRGVITKGAPIHNVKGQQAEIRYFAPDGHAPTTAVAYYEEKDLVMLLVLDSKTAAGMKAALPGFNGMVSSYQFVASNIQTPTQPKPRKGR